MGYYLRAFCASEELPPLRDVLEWTAGQGVGLEIDPDEEPLDLSARKWRQAVLVYAPGRQPFLVEAIRSTDEEELLADEVEEFVELLDDAPGSAGKARVLDHLKRSRAIVGTQLLGDADEETLTAAGTFLAFFVDHCGGLVQADGKGFYEGEALVVELA